MIFGIRFYSIEYSQRLKYRTEAVLIGQRLDDRDWIVVQLFSNQADLTSTDGWMSAGRPSVRLPLLVFVSYYSLSLSPSLLNGGHRTL